VHEAFRYDAFPPWTDPDTWLYRCDVCGFELTGAWLKASQLIHIVKVMEHTSAGRPQGAYLPAVRWRGILGARKTDV
jgi:hypothetical protein